MEQLPLQTIIVSSGRYSHVKEQIQRIQLKWVVSQDDIIIPTLRGGQKSPPMKVLHVVVSHQRQDIDTVKS